MTGDELLSFVNNELFPTLKNLPISADTPMNQRIIRAAFEDNNNYMKNGVLLRQVINIIDEIDFAHYQERHAFGDIYENILKSLQSAGNAGEFYTSRCNRFYGTSNQTETWRTHCRFCLWDGWFFNFGVKGIGKSNSNPF